MPISAITLLLTEESETSCIHPLSRSSHRPTRGLWAESLGSKAVIFKALWFFSSIISPLEELLQVWTVISWGQPRATHSPQQQSGSPIPANSVFIHPNWWVGTNGLPGIIQSMCANYSSFAPSLCFWACFPLQIILSKGLFIPWYKETTKLFFFTRSKLGNSGEMGIFWQDNSIIPHTDLPWQMISNKEDILPNTP